MAAASPHAHASSAPTPASFDGGKYHAIAKRRDPAKDYDVEPRALGEAAFGIGGNCGVSRADGLRVALKYAMHQGETAMEQARAEPSNAADMDAAKRHQASRKFIAVYEFPPARPDRLLQSMKAMHEADGTGSFVHCDVKLDNDFVSDDSRDAYAITGDFGETVWVPRDPANPHRTFRRRRFAGTPTYAAPEQLIADSSGHHTYSPAADMWSMGVTLFCILNQAFPFPREDGPKLREAVRSARHYAFHRAVQDDAKDLIEKLLSVDPTACEAAEALGHVVVGRRWGPGGVRGGSGRGYDSDGEADEEQFEESCRKSHPRPGDLRLFRVWTQTANGKLSVDELTMGISRITEPSEEPRRLVFSMYDAAWGRVRHRFPS
ncbi:hypothetical protein FNF28_07622 [Cafeteria roenbergensis]|uniref:Protein kinase domain-containing protein n=1 Tax=Cafeteria roenbergensis TaxID=33653 RepID=A0A5A8C411_CAFRO|nr:hypothetical protein FNF28_07622 [Cafeteria roenbergensis]